MAAQDRSFGIDAVRAWEEVYGELNPPNGDADGHRRA